MGIILRIALVVVSIISAAYSFRKIWKSHMFISDAIYWVVFSFSLLVVAVFPSIPIYGARLLGISSPANFVFLIMLFLIMTKLFGLSLELSEYKFKLRSLIQEYALRAEEQELGVGSEELGVEERGGTKI